MQALCSHLAQHGVGRVASGGSPPRFYLHAEPEGNNTARVLIEVVVNPATAAASVTLKMQDVTVEAEFQRLFTGFLECFSG